MLTALSTVSPAATPPKLERGVRGISAVRADGKIEAEMMGLDEGIEGRPVLIDAVFHGQCVEEFGVEKNGFFFLIPLADPEVEFVVPGILAEILDGMPGACPVRLAAFSGPKKVGRILS